MKHNIFIFRNFLMAVILVACTKDDNRLTLNKELTVEQNAVTTANGRGATYTSGVGFFDATDECNSAGQAASFAITMTGDLEGCHYVFIEESECSPSGTYREKGRELFVGTYKGSPGTFWTTYKFEAKYEGCVDGSPLGAEIFGRCQHPVTEGSGTGIFEGVTGRLDFKDDIEAGNYPYRGHLRF
jgi:hypothetical protein